MRRAALRAELRKKQGNRCCYCGIRMVISAKTARAPTNAETLEHLQRLQEGGSDARSNVALACHDCNTGRGTIDWLTYATIKRGEHYE